MFEKLKAYIATRLDRKLHVGRSRRPLINWRALPVPPILLKKVCACPPPIPFPPGRRALTGRVAVPGRPSSLILPRPPYPSSAREPAVPAPVYSFPNNPDPPLQPSAPSYPRLTPPSARDATRDGAPGGGAVATLFWRAVVYTHQLFQRRDGASEDGRTNSSR